MDLATQLELHFFLKPFCFMLFVQEQGMPGNAVCTVSAQSSQAL